LLLFALIENTQKARSHFQVKGFTFWLSSKLFFRERNPYYSRK